MLYALLFVASLLNFNSFTSAETLPIFNKNAPAPVLPGYDESANFSPAFHVLQNDPALATFASENYSGGQLVTGLCIPSSIANLLLYQISQRKTKLSHLKIPGLVPGADTVEGSEVVKGLIDQCHFTPSTVENPDASIGWFDSSDSNAIDCLSKIYEASDYPQTEIRYIRRRFQGLRDSRLIGRDPSLSDIRAAFQRGDEVIAMFSYQIQDPITGLWQETGSHSVNLFGYSANVAQTDNSMVVYFQNSNRLYNMDFVHPIFDTALLTKKEGLSLVPNEATAIEATTLQGRLINFAGKRTFLSGLVLVHVTSL